MKDMVLKGATQCLRKQEHEHMLRLVASHDALVFRGAGKRETQERTRDGYDLVFAHFAARVGHSLLGEPTRGAARQREDRSKEHELADPLHRTGSTGSTTVTASESIAYSALAAARRIYLFRAWAQSRRAEAATSGDVIAAR